MSLLFILESWVLNLDLDSWDLEPWILILVSRLSSWVLNSSWFLSWTLELFLIDLWFTWVVLCCYLIIPNLTSDKIVAAYYDGNRFITNLDGVWKVSCWWVSVWIKITSLLSLFWSVIFSQHECIELFIRLSLFFHFQ